MPNTELHTHGCWDYYGYSDRAHSTGYYATKLGFQMDQVYNMMTAFTKGKLRLTKADISGPEYIKSAE